MSKNRTLIGGRTFPKEDATAAIGYLKFEFVSLRGIFLAAVTGAALALSGFIPDAAKAAPYGSYGAYDYFGGYSTYSGRRQRYNQYRNYRRKKSRKPRYNGQTYDTGQHAPSMSYRPIKKVAFDRTYEKGAVVIVTSERRLYYVTRSGEALRYSIAVGKPHMQWFGRTFVQRKRKNPGWTPTARMRRNGAPDFVPPGPDNPLGVRAINLGWSEYRIHGTNAPGSIGRAASSGCFRMRNADVKDLFNRVHIGAPVYVKR